MKYFKPMLSKHTTKPVGKNLFKVSKITSEQRSFERCSDIPLNCDTFKHSIFHILASWVFLKVCSIFQTSSSKTQNWTPYTRIILTVLCLPYSNLISNLHILIKAKHVYTYLVWILIIGNFTGINYT